jgi:hypothetical protein
MPVPLPHSRVSDDTSVRYTARRPRSGGIAATGRMPADQEGSTAKSSHPPSPSWRTEVVAPDMITMLRPQPHARAVIKSQPSARLLSCHTLSPSRRQMRSTRSLPTRRQVALCPAPLEQQPARVSLRDRVVPPDSATTNSRRAGLTSFPVPRPAGSASPARVPRPAA